MIIKSQAVDMGTMQLSYLEAALDAASKITSATFAGCESIIT
jgi:hypothetical protein